MTCFGKLDRASPNFFPPRTNSLFLALQVSSLPQEKSREIFKLGHQVKDFCGWEDQGYMVKPDVAAVSLLSYAAVFKP